MKISTVMKAILVIWGVISLGSVLAALLSGADDVWWERLFPCFTSAVLSFGLAWVVEFQDNGA